MWLESHAQSGQTSQNAAIDAANGMDPATYHRKPAPPVVVGAGFRPTGDVTRFEPEQLTYDLDLGDATPEEFHRGNGPGRVYRSPRTERTAKSRSRGPGSLGFSKSRGRVPLRSTTGPTTPPKPPPKIPLETLKNGTTCCRSYGRPIPPRRQRKSPSLPVPRIPSESPA